MLTTKLDMLPDSWLKHYLNDTTQHAYCVTQAFWHTEAGPNGSYFAADFLCIFFVWKLLSCDLNCTEIYPKVPINNKSMLVEIMAQWPTGGKPGHQIDAKSSATTKLKKVLNVCRYWHSLNHTFSVMSSENTATILVILDCVNWSRKLTKIIDSERNFKANYLTL